MKAGDICIHLATDRLLIVIYCCPYSKDAIHTLPFDKWSILTNEPRDILWLIENFGRFEYIYHKDQLIEL